MAKYTPAPWTISAFFYPDMVAGDVFAKDAAKITDATPICRVYKPRSKNWCADKKNAPIDALTSLAQKAYEREVIEANARLIFAAPDLLEAAEALIDKIAHVNEIETERAALIAACVKAHGETRG